MRGKAIVMTGILAGAMLLAGGCGKAEEKKPEVVKKTAAEMSAEINAAMMQEMDELEMSKDKGPNYLSEEDLAVYNKGFVAKKAKGKITLDGVLDEADWQEADNVAVKFVFEPVDYRGKVSPTTAKILWDDEYLYVGFICSDKDVKSFSHKRDDTLWFGDVAEFFIKPFEDQTLYTEIVIAPNGQFYDGAYKVLWDKKGRDWDSEAEIATKINGTDNNEADSDSGYVVEFRVKMSKITGGAPAKEGDVWKFGAFRYDYGIDMGEKPLLLMSIKESKRGFHYYEGYRPVKFVK